MANPLEMRGVVVVGVYYAASRTKEPSPVRVGHGEITGESRSTESDPHTSVGLGIIESNRSRVEFEFPSDHNPAMLTARVMTREWNQHLVIISDLW